jgi:hypothetical protein
MWKGKINIGSFYVLYQSNLANLYARMNLKSFFCGLQSAFNLTLNPCW